MKPQSTFMFGVGATALLFGFLAGLANSPTAAGVLAIAGAASPIFLSKPKGRAAQSADGAVEDAHLRLAGICMGAFALAFLGGLAAGIGTKFIFREQSEPLEFVWSAAEQPTSAIEAVDWIVVTHRLHSMGYSHEKTVSIYNMRTKPSKAMFSNLESSYRPLSDLLKSTAVPFKEPFIPLAALPDQSKPDAL